MNYVGTRDTYQIELRTYVLFRLCLNWTMNGKSLKYFVIKDMFLAATLVRWMERFHCPIQSMWRSRKEMVSNFIWQCGSCCFVFITDESVYGLNEAKVCRFYAELLLRTANKVQSQVLATFIFQGFFVFMTPLVGRQDEHVACRIAWWGAGVVICMEQGENDLHTVQLMSVTLHHLLPHEYSEWFCHSVARYSQLSLVSQQLKGLFCLYFYFTFL